MQQLSRRPDADAGSDGQTPAQPLGQGDHVGHDADRLVGVEPARAADTGLHLVEDQQRAVLRRDLTCGNEIPVRRNDHAALPHDGFEKHCGGVGIDGCLERGDVSVGHVLDTGRHGFERNSLVGLSGERQCTHRPSVKGLLGGNDVGTTGQTRDLERRLVGLGTRVAEEHSSRRTRTQVCEQLLGQFDTRFRRIQIRRMTQSGELSSDRLDHRRMSVAQDIDGDTGQQVEVLLAVGVGHHSAFASNERYSRHTVVVHQRRGPPLL